MPVPAGEYLILAYQAIADFEFRIYSVTGQLMTKMKEKGGTVRQDVNIDKYTDGIYFYEIRRGTAVLQRGDLSILK